MFTKCCTLVRFVIIWDRCQPQWARRQAEPRTTWTCGSWVRRLFWEGKLLVTYSTWTGQCVRRTGTVWLYERAKVLHTRIWYPFMSAADSGSDAFFSPEGLQQNTHKYKYMRRWVLLTSEGTRAFVSSEEPSYTRYTVSQCGWSSGWGCLVLWGENPCCFSDLWWEKAAPAFRSANTHTHTHTHTHIWCFYI